MGTRFAFSMLGPLEVRAGGMVVPVSGQRQRTVLAMLLLAPGRVVSVDSLVNAVWEGAPPATGRTQIAICVAGLRKAFRAAGCTDDVIITSSPGYKLLADDHEIDAVRFEQECAAAEQAARQGLVERAADGMREALALWRGQVLAGVSGRVVESEAARLEELRLSAYERHTSLRLELGQHRELIGELTALVHDYPLREQARACLMLAQYRSGRRAEALETFRAGRRQFIEEFGMEPGPALQGLHRAILNDDADLALTEGTPRQPEPAARAVPAQLPTAGARFTGRTAEMSTLDELLEGDGPAVAFITGAAGIGKTELALRWGRRVAERFPDGQLFVDLRGYDGDADPARPEDALAGFLRAYGVADTQIPADPGERSALYRSLLDGKRTLVVLDNAASFAQVRPLLPGSGDNVVLVTGRDQIGELLGEHCALRLRLTPLSRAESVELLGAASAREGDQDSAGRLADLCGGLPLALSVSAARLVAKPHWSLAHLVRLVEDEDRRLDELSPGGRGVRSSLDASYRRLSPATATLYARLGLLDVPDFAAWVGAAVLDSGLAEAESLMEELVDAQLLEVSSAADCATRYRFHPLFRCHAKEKAMLWQGSEESLAACRRAFDTWVALATTALDRQPREIRGGLDTREHVGDPAAWFETERASVVAAIEQALRMGLVLPALDLATAAWQLLATEKPMPLTPVPTIASAEDGAVRSRAREKRWITKLMGELAS
ncbi:AfsR/SARP family transcriptional regulator [Allokutzneria albata]|uniref:DNA-binding transcriptional activator of the SARP family n=1 Tax=Allokutzneria albata TaxID=211114 RepID=A0A1G9WQS7_ALLAB|nr:AfsR/SARP family transcriptional regulator [Allokutzneria albata]SDM86954.1 DNA-binding transcriptional activator of the SARP family [Allokutzneria albata]